MMYGGIFAGLIIVFFMGYVILFGLDRHKVLNHWENTALSFLAGMGGLTLILFWSSFFYLPCRIYIVSLIIMATFIFVLNQKLRRERHNSFDEFSSWFRGRKTISWQQIVWSLIFILIMVKISYAFVEATSKPEYSWDACGHWTDPGRVIYALDQRGVANIPSILNKFGGVFPGYPKQIPYMHSWMFSWMGQANDQWSKIFLPLSLVSFLVYFYFSLKKQRGALEALFFVWLLLSAPLFVYHATFGYADFTVGLYFSTAIISFYRWIKEKQSVYFYLFAVFSACTTWIKVEGKPLYLIGLTLLLAYLWLDHKGQIKEKAIGIAQYLGAYALIGFPWQLLLIINRVATYETFELHFSYFPVLWSIFYNNIIIEGAWGIVWVGVVAAFLIFCRKCLDQENKYLILTIGLFHFVFPLVFLIFGMYYTFGAAVNRQWLNIYPVAIFTLGLIIPRIGNK